MRLVLLLLVLLLLLLLLVEAIVAVDIAVEAICLKFLVSISIEAFVVSSLSGKVSIVCRILHLHLHLHL